MLFTKLFFIAVPVFFIIDMVWLVLVARGFYKSQMGELLRTDINWVAAIIFYLLFVAGLILFVIQPAIVVGDWTHALVWGALFGFMTYATYDLTNLATLNGWNVTLALVDMAWGTVLSASVATVTCFIAMRVL
jgi:uncharacterized membrane protein